MRAWRPRITTLAGLVFAIHHQEVGNALHKPSHGKLEANVPCTDDEMWELVVLLDPTEGLDTMKNLQANHN